jgi:hypothetical protein
MFGRVNIIHRLKKQTGSQMAPCLFNVSKSGFRQLLFRRAKLMAPHGGLFVLLIPGAITPVVGYLVAIVVGTAMYSSIALTLFTV